MTYCSTYIGDLEDTTFKWDRGDRSGNIPGNIGPRFPPAPRHYNAIFHEWTDISGVTCKQTDFDGWVARVDRQQILDYIKYCYGNDDSAELRKLVEFVSGLDSSKIYGLVAECC